MPLLLRYIGQYTPLGAAVQAIQATMVGRWPHGAGLTVLAAYALVFAGASIRLFRWD
jgi:ABC-2 type transport system permease protein